MAKQVGPLFFTGTIDGIIFYEMDGKYYTRSKGSYKSAKHMRRNPKYKRTMANADQFGEASRLVREVYYQYVPKTMRKRGVYGRLTEKVRKWLHEGKDKKEAIALLTAHCQSWAAVQKQPSVHEQLSPVNDKRIATPPTPVNEQPSTLNVPPKPKQARYLSQWKVKCNGHLHIPQGQQAPYLNPSTAEEIKYPSVVQTE